MEFSKVNVHGNEYIVKDAISRELINNLSTVATTGDYDDLIDKPVIPTKTSDLTNDSGFITKNVNDLTNYTLTSNLSTVATTGDYDDLTNKPVIPSKMTILKYGISTWNDFINAYNENAIVYCRASSNSNPATGSQTRLSFMAYVNNSDNPTEVEFQYYRSVATHTDNQQGDQVFVYKLNKTTGWSVLTRNSYTKVDVGAGIKKTYSNGTLTVSLDVSVENENLMLL